MVLDVPVPDPDPNSKGGPNVVLSGLALRDSRGSEALFRKAAETAKTSKGAGRSSWTTTGPATERRSTGSRADPEKKATAEFGEPYGFVAFPEGALILAVGGNGLPVLKQALTAFANPGPSSKLESAQVAAEFVASQFALIYNATDPRPEPARQASRSAFAGKNASKDRLRISLRGENSDSSCLSTPTCRSSASSRSSARAGRPIPSPPLDRSAQRRCWGLVLWCVAPRDLTEDQPDATPAAKPRAQSMLSQTINDSTSD